MFPKTTPTHNSCYHLITQAAQTINKELSLFADSSSDEEDNNNNNDEDLEREMLFLRSTLEYFYANKAYPLATPNHRADFCRNHLVMTQYEYITENERLRNKYKKRVKKICKGFQLLDEPHEQDAFDLGNRIWGTRSLEMLQEVEDNNQEVTMLSAEEEEDDEREESHDDDDEEGILNRYPFLKGTFRFGSGLRIPVVSEYVVEKGFVSLGEDMVKRWDERLKKLQIEEMKNFLAQLNLIRHQTMTLLDVLQNGAT